MLEGLLPLMQQLLFANSKIDRTCVQQPFSMKLIRGRESQNKHRSTKVSGEKVLKKKKYIDINMKERVGDRIGDSKAASSFTLLIISFPFLNLSAY